MKHALLMLAMMIALSSCDKCKTTVSPSNPDSLPPYTETGANTFGCLVNGKVFKPQANFGSSAIILQSNYQFVAGRNQFTLRGSDFVNHTGVSLIMDSATLKQDSIYQFDYYWTQNNSARYHNDTTFYTRKPQFTGELNVKHFDPVQNILSGTFWFDAADTASGKVVQIRDGRFDVHFTR